MRELIQTKQSIVDGIDHFKIRLPRRQHYTLSALHNGMNSCFEMPPKRKRVSANMAANVNSKPGCWKVPEVYKHHEQHNACFSRPKYRDGRRAKAVKVRKTFLMFVAKTVCVDASDELIIMCKLVLFLHLRM